VAISAFVMARTLVVAALLACCSSGDESGGEGEGEEPAEPLESCAPGVWLQCVDCQRERGDCASVYTIECGAADCRTCNVKIFAEEGTYASSIFRIGGGHFTWALADPPAPELCPYVFDEGQWSTTADGGLDVNAVVREATCSRSSMRTAEWGSLYERAPDGLAQALVGAWQDGSCIEVPYHE
jgi:hypothetical protein